jgi:predicted phosphodiesterase
MTTLYCGDPHGQFRHILDAVDRTNAAAVVLLGDMEPSRPLEEEMAPLTERGIRWCFIGGNHDADSPELVDRVWNQNTNEHNVHGRVVTLPDGTRLAGLAGVFREAVWYPDPAAARGGAPAFRTREEHTQLTPCQDRWQGGHHFKHWGTIYPHELDTLAELEADVLVSHEAPGYHPNGFEILDVLAQSMGVKVSVHGHHHDALDSSTRWATQGFKSFGVGLRGITAIDAAGVAKVIVPGELDAQRAQLRRPAV